MTSTTNGPIDVSKVALNVAGATSLRFAGDFNAALGAAGLAVAGFAVVGLAGAGFGVVGFWVAGLVCAGVDFGCVSGGLPVPCAKPVDVESASAAPNMTADIAFDRTFIALPLMTEDYPLHVDRALNKRPGVQEQALNPGIS